MISSILTLWTLSLGCKSFHGVRFEFKAQTGSSHEKVLISFVIGPRDLELLILLEIMGLNVLAMSDLMHIK